MQEESTAYGGVSHALPALPEPHLLSSETEDGLHHYTASQMRAYGEACRAEERDLRGQLQAECANMATRLMHAEACRASGVPSPLTWVRNGDKDCCYDNWLAETPFGRILITWKGWKEYHDATVDEFPGPLPALGGEPDDVREQAEMEFVRRLALAAPPSPTAPSAVEARWIPVTERLPADGNIKAARGEVVVMCGNVARVEYASYVVTTVTLAAARGAAPPFAHWMPLPEPPHGIV